MTGNTANLFAVSSNKCKNKIPESNSNFSNSYLSEFKKNQEICTSTN